MPPEILVERPRDEPRGREKREGGPFCVYVRYFPTHNDCTIYSVGELAYLHCPAEAKRALQKHRCALARISFRRGERECQRDPHQRGESMSEHKTEGKDHKEDDDEEDLEEPDLKVKPREGMERGSVPLRQDE